MKTDDIEIDNAGQTQYQWFYIMMKTFFTVFIHIHCIQMTLKLIMLYKYKFNSYMSS